MRLWHTNSERLKSTYINIYEENFVALIASYFIHLPMKLVPTVSSETLAIRTQTPGNYPKRYRGDQYESA